MRYLPKSPSERKEMLDVIGVRSAEELFHSIPEAVRLKRPLNLPGPLSETELIQYFRERAAENSVGYTSFLGAGVYNHLRSVVTDTIIQRGEFLTSYTPYQAEISQGTLQAIFEFQTLMCELTGQEVANASMWDGSTATTEAVLMAERLTNRRRVLVARSLHPEYRAVLAAYASNLGLEIREIGFTASGQIDVAALGAAIDQETAAVVVQSPNFLGVIEPVAQVAQLAHAAEALAVVAITEGVSLGVVRPPVEADIVALEAQSFGLPPSYGGPYAGAIATRDKFVRQMPGRLAGQTTDSHGRRGFCLTLATREQHIRRERATSNICTNQALCALAATVHLCLLGKEGLREMAEQNLAKAQFALEKLEEIPGVKRALTGPVFNEFVIRLPRSVRLVNADLLRRDKIIGPLPLGQFYPDLTKCGLVCVTETTSRADIERLAAAVQRILAQPLRELDPMDSRIRKARRHVSQSEGLIFEKSAPGKRGTELPPLDVPAVDPRKVLGAEYVRDGVEGLPEVSEIEVIRHFTRLSTWNYAIDLGMYPLGSCTMKYNPRVNEFVARLDGLATEHPYQPQELSQGCLRILATLRDCLLEITGMDAATLQPAAGAQGELTGLLLIRAYLASRGNPRKKVLIPDSAHGTNPATAVIAGYEVENIRSDSRGQLDIARLKELVTDDVAALMVTNPSTLGTFEPRIAEAAEVLHSRGALLYMDGANMNALAGVARPGDFGVDVMHLNLHKTFSTPHGGGGPGAGPVLVKQHLEPFLPIPVLVEKEGRLVLDSNRKQAIGRVRAFVGNFGVLVRALAYTLAYGPGIRQATEDAVVNANYIRKQLEDVYELPYDSPSMHEVIFSDARQKKFGVSTMDIAKRLIDYGFHPYTTAFPLIVPGALMIEPTESESKEECDLFIDAMRSISEEAATEPELVKTAPHSTRVGRLDEVGAARRPVLRWKPKSSQAAD